ncbi:hypothetical protein B6V73_20015 [Thioclava sp. JM3]|uniref:PRC-barrel domain-containing protein n=1 Tax=Thioclava sp. JM3 TaxID=1973004 RepID=UPI000B53A270|nr:PRC-barrel domain-containing protein [Thioclava sp. JM3]OWY08871.1 hypothetical protein B6V73_20015 [Thioclava sp. JM3]
MITDDAETVVEYLVGSGGFLGIGEKHVFVPKDQTVVKIDGISVELVIQLDAAGFRIDIRLD